MNTVDLFDEDIEQLHDDLSAEPWLQLSVDDVRNSSQLPIRISYEYADMGDLHNMDSIRTLHKGTLLNISQ